MRFAPRRCRMSDALRDLLTGVRILWLDPDRRAFTAFGDALPETGALVTHVSDVDEAVRAVPAGGFDLVITEMWMPPGQIFGEDAMAKGGHCTGMSFERWLRDPAGGNRSVDEVPLLLFTNAGTAYFSMYGARRPRGRRDKLLMKDDAYAVPSRFPLFLRSMLLPKQ